MFYTELKKVTKELEKKETVFDEDELKLHEKENSLEINEAKVEAIIKQEDELNRIQTEMENGSLDIKLEQKKCDEEINLVNERIEENKTKMLDLLDQDKLLNVEIEKNKKEETIVGKDIKSMEKQIEKTKNRKAQEIAGTLLTVGASIAIGVLTGGFGLAAIGAIGGVVGVCKNANDINESIQQLESDLETLKKKLEDVKQNLRTARKKKDTNKLDYTKLEEIKKNLREEKKMFNDRKSVVSKNIEDVARLLTTYSSSLTRLDGEKQLLDSSIKEARIKTENSKSEYETSKTRREDLNEKKTELLQESACLIQSSKDITSTLSTTVDALKKVKAESANLKLNKQSAEMFFKQTVDEISKKNNIIKGLRENYDDLKKSKSKVLNEKGSVDLNGLSSEITKIKNVKISADANLNTLKESGKNLVSNIDRNIKAAAEFKNEVAKVDKEISKNASETALLTKTLKVQQNQTN